MSRFAASYSWLGIASLTLLGGCNTPRSSVVSETAKKPVAVKLVSVTQEEVQQSTLQPATVHAFYEAEIRARSSGYVHEVKADIGDFVEKGAPLAVIHVPEMDKQKDVFKARISRDRAKESQAEAGVVLAEANVKSSEAKLAQAKSELSRADASLAAMEAEFKRTNDLVERRSLESRILDEVRKKRDSEQANKDAMESAITSAEADVAVAVAKLDSAKADLKAAQAQTVIAQKELEELDVLIEYATLKAPFSGVVTRRSVDPGDLVREGNEVGNEGPLFILSRIDKVRVHIPVPEREAAFVSRDDVVKLSFPSFDAEQDIEASVTRLTTNLDPSTRTMLVEVEMENRDRKFLPGMFGQAEIVLTTKAAKNMLPARAVRFSESGDAYVYLVDAERKVTVTSISTGADNGHSIEVKSGLEVGQRVIDAHLKRFANDQIVTVLSD